MADLDRLARAIFGTKRAETETDNVGVFEQTKTIYADATSDSSNGSVRVYIPGMMTTVEGETDIELPTTTDVKDGDSVIITLTGGTAAHPVVTGVVGGGDRTRADVDNAVSDASQAADSAKAAAGSAQSTADTAVADAAKAQSSADRAQGTADDAWSRTLRVQVESAPADAAGDTSTLTATVWRGGERLAEQEVAMMGLVAWYVGGSRVATGYTYSCAAGTAAECRLEA